MAAPVDSARQGTNISTAATSHAINVGSPVAGTLLIVCIRFAAAPGTVTFTGYTILNGAGGDSSDASDDTTMIFGRIADGTEGATDTLSTTNSVKLSAMAYEVTGASSNLTHITLSTVAVGTTTANTANPTAAVPTSAPEDTLYIAFAGGDGEVGAYTGAPANYANLATANSGTGGAAATNNFMGTASRGLTASSSEDPGAFTHAAHSNGWTAYTVAIVGPQPVVDTPTIQGALGSGVAPAPIEPVTSQGAVAQGQTAPAPKASSTIQGALGDGVAPTARTTLTISGASAGGTSPSFAGVVDNVSIGGATASGFAPTEIVTSGDTTTIQGALASGNAVTIRSTFTISGAAAAGASPASWISTTIAGALAGGVDSVAEALLGQGGALADGATPTTQSTLTPGGALAGGNAPTEQVSGGGLVSIGGAIAAGLSPSVAVTSTTGGALVGGIDVSGISVQLTIDGALAGGRAPFSLGGTVIYLDPIPVPEISSYVTIGQAQRGGG